MGRWTICPFCFRRFNYLGIATHRRYCKNRPKRLLLAACAVLLLVVVPSASAYKPGKFCTPDSTHEATYCRCLFIHPKWEFCESSSAPLPSCCRATEPKSKITACGCCPSKKLTVSDRGWYEHQPEVEYDIGGAR